MEERHSIRRTAHRYARCLAFEGNRINDSRLIRAGEIDLVATGGKGEAELSGLVCASDKRDEPAGREDRLGRNFKVGQVAFGSA